MTTKISPTGRYDAIDREHFRTMIESDQFKLVMARISAERDRATVTCTRSPDQVELLRAQGAVAALDTALELPARLLVEMAARIKAG